MPTNNKEPDSMTTRLLTFCLAVLVGVVVLYMAFQLTLQFWGWLVLLAAVITTVTLVVVIVRRRRDRW